MGHAYILEILLVWLANRRPNGCSYREGTNAASRSVIKAQVNKTDISP